MIFTDCSAEKTFDCSIKENRAYTETDGTPADKSLNEGACFKDYSGEIKSKIPALTGAYTDDKRGVLKVTDVTSAEYPLVSDIFEYGVYHLYDYRFFYRNLQKNVQTRINSFNK